MKRKKEEIYKDKALSYIDNVMSGKRKAGELERLEVERHVRDLKLLKWGCILMRKQPRKYLVFASSFGITRENGQDRNLCRKIGNALSYGLCSDGRQRTVSDGLNMRM